MKTKVKSKTKFKPYYPNIDRSLFFILGASFGVFALTTKLMMWLDTSSSSLFLMAATSPAGLGLWGISYLSIMTFALLVPGLFLMMVTVANCVRFINSLYGREEISLEKEHNKPFKIIPVLESGWLASLGIHKPYHSTCSAVIEHALNYTKDESDDIYQRYCEVAEKYSEAIEKPHLKMPEKIRHYETTLTMLKNKLDKHNKKTISMICKLTEKAVKSYPELFYAEEIERVKNDKEYIEKVTKSLCHRTLKKLGDNTHELKMVRA